MAERLVEKRARTLMKNRRRRLWTRIVSVLGCLVVFCTVYALVEATAISGPARVCSVASLSRAMVEKPTLTTETV